jgi:hypothetical protein
VRIADPILRELDQGAQTTKRVLERIPEDKLTRRPHPGSFPLGELALHIAAAPGNFVALALQDIAEVPNFTRFEPKNCKEVMDKFSKSIESAKDALKNMDDTRLTATWTLRKDGKLLLPAPTRIGFLRLVLMNHTYHPR